MCMGMRYIASGGWGLAGSASAKLVTMNAARAISSRSAHWVLTYSLISQSGGLVRKKVGAERVGGEGSRERTRSYAVGKVWFDQLPRSSRRWGRKVGKARGGSCRQPSPALQAAAGQRSGFKSVWAGRAGGWQWKEVRSHFGLGIQSGKEIKV